MTIETQHITTDKASMWWPAFSAHVEKAASRYGKDYDLEHMRDAIFDGKAALFGVFRNYSPVAAIVTSEVVYPKRKVMLIELIGGDSMADWFDEALEAMKTYAINAGYGGITAQGRMGWRDYAKRANFQPAFVGYEIDLETNNRGPQNGQV